MKGKIAAVEVEVKGEVEVLVFEAMLLWGLLLKDLVLYYWRGE